MLRGLLRFPFVMFIAWTAVPLPARADVPAHLARLGVPAWHAKGITGSGLTVAILDSGFRGYREHLGKGLPLAVQTCSFRNDGNLEAKASIHGLLCAEVVHAIAPGAKLLFANWEPDSPPSFLKAVAWARQRGATIITCSMIMPGWSDGLGGGDLHRNLAKLLEGSLFFASAGNLAQRHWTGAFHDDGKGWHTWSAGQTKNEVLPWGQLPVAVELVARDSSTYRLTVLDDAGKPVSAAQALAPGIRGSAIRFVPRPGATYQAKVEIISGSGGEFRLVVLGGELEISTETGCMVFPGDGKDVIAVGAISPRNERLAISARGSIVGRVKPDCVAPTPFASQIRSEPFGGTSAAAPQAAGLAALLWAREPNAGVEVIRKRILKHCEDVGTPGVDAETGHGVICLPRP